MPDLVVVGASAGGVEALRRLVSGFPERMPAAVVVVLHIAADSDSRLPSILAGLGRLPAKHASDGDPLAPGEVLVAPPGLHLVVEGDRVRLLDAPVEHGTRPSIDPLFRTAAAAHGRLVTGVLLSGASCDGALGLGAIRARRGLTAVQDPQEAIFERMPECAIERGVVDEVLPAREIGRLVGERIAAATRATA
jgi:two-component system, chemotaxis family, protein-glutamate methylesterase/glutaminase